MSGYYGVRRSFLSDSDFHSSKQFSNDLYPSSGVTKPFACESSAGQSHPGLLESYLAEPYGDYRPPALTSTPGSLFGTSTLPPLLPPPFPGDPTHFVFVSMVISMCREEGEAPAPVAQPSYVVTKLKPEITHLGIPALLCSNLEVPSQAGSAGTLLRDSGLHKDHINQGIETV